MKKKWLTIGIGLVLVGLMTGCGSLALSTEAQAESNPVVEAEKQSIVDGEQEDNRMQEQRKQEDVVWTKSDIQLESYHMGYLSDVRFPEGKILVVSNATELTAAEGLLHLDLDEVNADNEYSEIAIAFQNWKEQYPIENYTYYLMYQEVNSGGYDLEVDQLQIENGNMTFGYSQDSTTPGEGDSVIAVMDGFLFLAAVDKNRANEIHIDNVWDGSTSVQKKKPIS